MNLKAILLIIIQLYFVQSISAQTPNDWRNIKHGNVIPDETYSDQPYLIKTNDGALLCILTTAAGIEGSSSQYVAVTRSLDQGKTWSKLLPLEPINGPEASYAVVLKVPSGRVYAFYNHNTDNVREIKTDLGGSIKRVDSQGYFVFRFSDDHGVTWSSKRYTIPVREFSIDKKNVYGGKIRFFWNVGKAFIDQENGYVPLSKVGGFGDGFFTSTEGVLLKSSNILTEQNPDKIKWETLPDGNTGLKTPPGGGPIAEEQSYSVLSDGSFFVVYRSIDGHSVYSYSRDKGRTWDTPKYMTYADGTLIKQPRAANFAWKCNNGKFLYWFNNHGGLVLKSQPNIGTTGYFDRNPAWVCMGTETDSPKGKKISWSQPEILLYDDDPIIRMSYPDLIENSGNYYITETQKDVARIHKIDAAFLNTLWSQFDLREKNTDGLVREWKFKDQSFPVKKDSVTLKSFYVRNNDRQDHGGKNVLSGFTIDINFNLKNLHGGQVLLDTRNEAGKGMQLITTDDRSIRLEMSDGRTLSSWTCDKSLEENKTHHLSVIVDGGPKVIMFVLDGRMQDGGTTRQFGWGRFNPYLQDLNGNKEWTIGKNMDGGINQLNFYNRAILVTEAIGNYRHFLPTKE